jgi:hypothetical protein
VPTPTQIVVLLAVVFALARWDKVMNLDRFDLDRR